MTKKEFAKILRDHKKWVDDNTKGVRADLSGADLYRANLENARNLYYSHVPEEGAFVAWKKCRYDVLVKLLIPEDAERTSSIVGRKCRASKAMVLAIWDKDGNEVKEALGLYNGYRYTVGKEVIPDKYDPDPRVECSNGIHFFITKQEAVDYEV
jgi:hypothetical protein